MDLKLEKKIATFNVGPQTQLSPNQAYNEQVGPTLGPTCSKGGTLKSLAHIKWDAQSSLVQAIQNWNLSIF